MDRLTPFEGYPAGPPDGGGSLLLPLEISNQDLAYLVRWSSLTARLRHSPCSDCRPESGRRLRAARLRPTGGEHQERRGTPGTRSGAGESRVLVSHRTPELAVLVGPPELRPCASCRNDAYRPRRGCRFIWAWVWGAGGEAFAYLLQTFWAVVGHFSSGLKPPRATGVGPAGDFCDSGVLFVARSRSLSGDVERGGDLRVEPGA
jgi:hypothetical protein